jgi:hypothetical protein
MEGDVGAGMWRDVDVACGMKRYEPAELEFSEMQTKIVRMVALIGALTAGGSATHWLLQEAHDQVSDLVLKHISAHPLSNS